MPTGIKTVLILKADRLYAKGLADAARTAFPGAAITSVRSVNEAAVALTKPCDFFLAGVDARHGDVLGLLLRRHAASGRTCPVLLLAGPDDERVLAATAVLPIDGIFDPESDGPEALIEALRRAAAGLSYRSETHLRRLDARHGVAFTRLLTAGEQLFFAIMGDGCDDRVAAQALGVSRHTVSTVRRELHRKLRIQHRGELVRLAVQHGFVRFTPDGVMRPGLALLAAAYHSARERRAPRETTVVHLAPLHPATVVRCA